MCQRNLLNQLSRLKLTQRIYLALVSWGLLISFSRSQEGVLRRDLKKVLSAVCMVVPVYVSSTKYWLAGVFWYKRLVGWLVDIIIIKYYQPPMFETNREASNRLNYYAVGLASCRFLVDAVEVRDTYTNEMRSHSHYPFSPLEQCSYS
jgi:hypothetical protein